PDQAMMDDLLDSYESNGKQTIDGIHKVAAIVKTHPDIAKFSNGEKTLEQYLTLFDNQYSIWYNAYAPKAAAGDYDKQTEAFDIARDTINTMQDMVVEFAQAEKIKLHKSTVSGLATVAVIILLVFAGIATFCVFIIRYIRINVKAVTKSVESIAALNLSEEISANGNADEIGRLTQSATKLQTELKSIIGTLQDASKELESSSDFMAQNTTETAESMKNVDIAVGELATTASTQAEDIEKISGKMTEITGEMEKSAKSTDNLDSACKYIEVITNDGMKIVDRLTDITDRNVQAFEKIFEAINGIDERTNNISTASDLISSIAQQTNLLSLNASIEAARAGEAGRGFAVVADEIRNLAEQSASSASTINEMLDQLKESANYATEQSELVKEFVEKQRASVEDTKESFTTIVNNLKIVNDDVATLNSVNTALGGDISEINELVTSLAAASQENAATSEELTATTTTVAGSVDEIKEIGGNVNNSSKDLAEIIGRFRL
ncbi:MAG: hypothetical protein J6X36_00005, partial [Lachnospiraceae bacterium]|nr:hypothetical protein [Lachnospiraceae bacterium]